MQPGEALGVTAQVAVTLAGFAGIVVVFRPQSIHEWSPVDKLRLRLLLMNSSLPLTSSLFGMFLLTFDPPPVAIWRWCSAFALVITLSFVISNSASGRRIPRPEQRDISKPLYYLLAVLGTATMILQAINLAVWDRFWPFFAAIFLNLVAAIAQFVRFLLLPHRT